MSNGAKIYLFLDISHKDHHYFVFLSTIIMPLYFCHETAFLFNLSNGWKVKEL